MQNEGNSGDESMQGWLSSEIVVAQHAISNQGSETEGETQPQPQQQLARQVLQAFETVQQHSIANQGSETADGTQPPLQQQSGRPATAQRKRNAGEISEVDRTAKKREADRAYREKTKAAQLKIKSEWDKLVPENEQLKLENGKLKSKLETLTAQNEHMKLEIEEKDHIIQEKDQQMKSNLESLKAENDQLKFQILEKQNQVMKATTERLEAEKKLLECQNKLLQKDLAIANQSLQTQSIELPRLPYDSLTAHGLQRIWSRRGKMEQSYSLSSLQGRETFLNYISSPIMPFLTPREMDAGRETLRILRALIILVERTPRSHFERLRDRDDLVKELTRIILQVKRRLAVGMHTLRTLRSHFELPRDGGDLDILVKDSAGKIWKFCCCSARVTCKPVIFGGWVFFVPNQMSSK